MKTAVLIAAMIAVATAHSVTEMQHATFKSWMAEHGKEYDTQAEYETRLRLYLNNLELAQRDQAIHGARFGSGPFMDMDEEEWRALYLPRTFSADELINSMPLRAFTEELEAPKSDGVDWRTKGAVTTVKNQASCGSCWAFSATGAVEGAWAVAGHTAQSLSPQQLMDCDTMDNACNGGLPWNAFTYYTQAGGAESWDDYAYTARKGSCNADKSKFVAKISSWEHSPSDEVQLAAYLEKYGPLSIGINANGIMRYSSGILRPTHASCDPRGLNHGIVMVGFGSEDGVDFWIVKNSWGSQWGEGGYMRIERGTSACGLNTAVTRPIV